MLLLLLLLWPPYSVKSQPPSLPQEPLSLPQEPPSLPQLAWLTPILGDISQECFLASLTYLGGLNLSQNMTWGLDVVGTNGRLPVEGGLSDTVPIPLDLCQMEQYRTDVFFAKIIMVHFSLSVLMKLGFDILLLWAILISLSTF